MSKIPVFDIGDTLLPSHSKINKAVKDVVGENAPELDVNRYNIYVPEEMNEWLEKKDIDANGKEITQRYVEWKSEYLKQNVIPELKRINREFGPIGFISDNSEPAKKFYAQNFREAGLEYKGFVVSAEVGVKKPDPRIFEAFVEEREEAAERFVYFGNYVDRDKAAEKIGMGFVWVKSFHTFGSSTEGIQIDRTNYRNVRNVLNQIKDEEQEVTE